MSDLITTPEAGRPGKPVVWALPWSCPDCHGWGYVGVCVEKTRPERTTDEQAMKWIGEKHREYSRGMCLRSPERILMGRLRRREKATTEHPEGKMIFMLKKGETEQTPIDPTWPQWDQA